MSIARPGPTPFGAECSADGTRFRLWAPAAQRVELLLYRSGVGHPFPMRALGEGWFEESVPSARAGMPYRFRIDGRHEVPDPASRFNPDGVHGPSVVVDGRAFGWTDAAWRGIPWHQAVIYELHVGLFTSAGTFRAIVDKLDHLAELGVTMLELMPLTAFAGRRGWGYDGVLPYAPAACYGSPDDLKFLIDRAHARGLGVLLDVVYNHFGPEGNYLHRYAPGFFTDRHQTPWGPAIRFDGPGSEPVRQFFLHNARYWLEEFHADGLRLDAVHSIHDESPTHIVHDIAAVVRAAGGARQTHLILENADNQPAFLGPPAAPDRADAQWHDAVHHCLHTLLTGERDGYYESYADRPVARLCRAFEALPASAYVSFLQNHDQIGNRAFGERLARLVPDSAALLAATAVVMLAPMPVMLFMGEEWSANEPFLYFCDFEPELAQRVREGRRREFARFAQFAGDGDRGAGLPDPAAPATFERCRLDWSAIERSSHAASLSRHRELLALRHRHIAPLLPDVVGCEHRMLRTERAFLMTWKLRDAGALSLLANLSREPLPAAVAAAGATRGTTLFCTDSPGVGAASNALPPWSVRWTLRRGG